QEGVVAVPDVEGLLDPDRGEPTPEVPGFTLVARIGRGASGRVYLGRADGGEPREVALKVLDHVLAADTAWRARVRREYETMRRLHSPGVVKVYDLLEHAPAGPTIVMEYVRGMDLQATVASGPLDVDTAVTLCDEVLLALREAHDHGVVHRDIKPSNVLRDANGRARVLDFGIARVQGDATLTRTSDGLGTLAFAAPEQREGRAVDRRADVYGVGRLLGFLVSGSTRWEDHAACLPGALQSAYRQATQDEPAERFADAEAFRAALRRAREAGWAGAPIGPGQPLSPTMRVETVLVRLEPGLWVLRGRDEAMDEAVGLLVAERNELATGALQRALQALGEARRRDLGVDRVQHTSDGLRWCTLPAADPTAAAREILAPPKVAPPPPPPPPKVAPSSGSGLSGFASGAMAISALVAGVTPVGILLGLGAAATGGGAKRVVVPPYLADWPEPDAKWTPRALGTRLDDLALVVHAQGQALGMPLDAEGWLELRRTPLRAASEVLTDPVTRWPAPLAAHLHKTRTRGRALQAVLHLQAWLEAGVTDPPGRNERAGIDLAMGVLHAVALLGASHVPPERLAPWIFPGPDGWCARGTMERFWHPLGRGPA
ncbi:MAG: serine/threonine-protein kinase, partial [Myxococcota bacterium]